MRGMKGLGFPQPKKIPRGSIGILNTEKATASTNAKIMMLASKTIKVLTSVFLTR